MNNFTATLLVITVLLVLLPTETYAFGAGEIPDFAYLNDKAFRHGDIENILAELAKTAGHAASGGGLFSIAKSMFNAASGGSKFSSSDVKRVYFGNWLRDYSQAMDIAGLSKLSADTLVLIVSVLGFLTFGFATEEYQVTPERLGVYLPVEHIDNPKGYGEAEGDARQFHPKLRPPVNPQELEIDPRTGMKNYMATENRGWDTSTAHIRRTFRACIDHGRRSRGEEGAELWEAYRLLGTGLHTMEDLLAHSNWCELALRKMGHEQVFCHVGENVIINTPNGEAPPLITGTFGSADFLHSLMGEATDHLSQASVVDLSTNLANAQQNSDSGSSPLRSILAKLPLGGGSAETDEKLSQADVMKEKAQAYHFNPDDIAPAEVQQQMWELLVWRDSIYREVVGMIEMVPGLDSLIDTLTNTLNAYVYTILAPYLTPLLQEVIPVLGEGSKAVIDSEDQYEVFDNPNASDPSHSLLSKDHFSLILNEAAGKTAQVVVRYTVNLIVQAWFDERVNPDKTIDQILEAFHHPYFNVGRSQIQQEMFQEMEKWIGEMGPEVAEKVIESLTKESVRAGKNKREGSDDDMAQSQQVYGQSQSHAHGGGYGSSAAQGYQAPQGSYGGREEGGYRQESEGRYQSAPSEGRYNSSSEQENRRGGAEYGSQGQGRGEYESSQGRYESSAEQGYHQGQGRGGYGASEQRREEYESSENESRYQAPSETRYGGGQRDEYGETGSRYTQESTGGVYGRTEDDSYGRRRPVEPVEESYNSEGYTRPHGETAYGAGGEEGYTKSGYDRDEERSYGARSDRPRADEEQEGRGYQPSYQQPSRESRESEGYGAARGEYGGYDTSERRRSGEDEYGERRVHREAQPEYGDSRRYASTTRYGEDESERPARAAYSSSEFEPQAVQASSGYVRESGYGESQAQPQYGRPTRGGEYGEGNEYSTRERSYDADAYGQSEIARNTSRAYGGEEGYAPARAERGYGEEAQGYGGNEYGAERRAPAYGEGYGASAVREEDDTFGAERLNINEGYGEEEERPHHGRHHRNYDEE